jgi:HEAT repeat protein
LLEQEIRDIAPSAPDAGKRLNEIADQFRRGRDANDLVSLLDSDEPELVSIAAWILGELHPERYEDAQIISRLWALVDHQDSAVRFEALGAIFPFLRGQDAATQALLATLRSDPNEGVRRSAEAAAARLTAN